MIPVVGWILDPVYQAMGAALAFFYSVVGSYGVAIALLTVTVRIFLIPLTAKQVRSQQAMQRIQPEIKRLQAKHKNDRQKLNEEMMKFYKENKVNPLAGCLPILLQAPLFLVLYRLILGLTNLPEPKHLPRDSEMFTSLLDSGGKMLSWGVDLARSASSVKGFGNALPYYLLIALTVATGYYQQRQMTARLPKDAVNPQMQMIGKVFPAFIGIFSFSIPAGVVVYFIVSNLWQVGQQAITFRTFPPPVAGPTSGAKDGKSGGKDGKSGAVGPKEGGGGPRGGGGGPKRSPDKGRGPKGSSPGSRSGSGAGRTGESGRSSGRTTGRVTPPKAKPSSSAKRPPPSPRPKGLPSSITKPGAKGPSTRNSRRKDD